MADDVAVLRDGCSAACDADADIRRGPILDLPQRIHGGDAKGMNRRLISSGAAFEERVGYSRAVVADGYVWVSGTAPIMPDDADPPADAYGQARRCLEVVAAALAEAGATLDNVVRTRIYLTRADLIDDVGRAHAEAFAAARPATTAIVAELLDARWLVEIEAEAILPADR